MAQNQATSTTVTTASGRAAQDLELRAKRAVARSKIAEFIEKNIKRLPKEFVDSIKLLVNLEGRKAPNSLYTRVINFISGNAVEGVDHDAFPPPKKGEEVDDYTLFKAFKVAETDMNKVIYQGQENKVWIAARKVARDVYYKFYGEGEEMPEGYPGPIRKKKKEEDTPVNGEETTEMRKQE